MISVPFQIDSRVTQQYSLSPGSALSPVRSVILGRIQGEFLAGFWRGLYFLMFLACPFTHFYFTDVASGVWNWAG